MTDFQERHEEIYFEELEFLVKDTYKKQPNINWELSNILENINFDKRTNLVKCLRILNETLSEKKELAYFLDSDFSTDDIHETVTLRKKISKVFEEEIIELILKQ